MANDMMSRRNGDLMNDRFFDNLERRLFEPGSWFDFAPSIASTAINGLPTDVKETKDAYEVHVDVPGISKDAIKVNYHDGVLSINVKKEDTMDHSDKDGNILMSERRYGAMSRSYQLPNVDVANIKATQNDGILEITLPKLTEAQDQGNNIEIN